MQKDNGNVIFIGVSQSCNNVIMEAVNNVCRSLSAKNSRGGQLLLVSEQDINYQRTDLIVNSTASQVYLTDYNGSFKVKLTNSHNIFDGLYALIAPWFLSNLIGNDYADQQHCLKNNDIATVNFIEISTVQQLHQYLLNSNLSKATKALSCYIEPSTFHCSLASYTELAELLPHYFCSLTFSVMTMSANLCQQTKSRVYLTTFTA